MTFVFYLPESGAGEGFFTSTQTSYSKEVKRILDAADSCKDFVPLTTERKHVNGIEYALDLESFIEYMKSMDGRWTKSYYWI